MGFVQTMPKALSIDKPVDSNLKPVKDSDGTMTALEVSIDKVRVKDLEVLGTATGITHTDATKHPLTTVGIADDNLVEIDDADAANNDYAKFTANGLEGRSYSEVLSDLGVEANADVTDATNVTAAGALMDSELTDLAGVKGVTISDLQVKPSEGAFANGDKTKLDAIESGADVTDATNVTAAGALMDSELAGIAAVKATTGTFLSADETKLDGIEASADVTDATNVTSAGALMDSEVTNLADVKAFDTGDYATAAQGTLATNALPKAGGTMTGDLNIAATDKLTFDGGGDTYITESSADVLDIKVGNDLVLQITESGADGNTIDIDNACIGFTQLEPTYDATTTIVDFRLSNKQFVTFGAGNITNLSMHFPLVSGNFVVLLKQDGTGSRTITNYKVFEFDESAADGHNSVKWAGGTTPTLTTDANHVDIFSFYWDADNEIAYGVATLDFQF